MLCISWNFEEVLHFEFVSDGHAVNIDLYAQQMQQVYDTLKAHYLALGNQRHALLQYDKCPSTHCDQVKT